MAVKIDANKYEKAKSNITLGQSYLNDAIRDLASFKNKLPASSVIIAKAVQLGTKVAELKDRSIKVSVFLVHAKEQISNAEKSAMQKFEEGALNLIPGYGMINIVKTDIENSKTYGSNENVISMLKTTADNRFDLLKTTGADIADFAKTGYATSIVVQTNILRAGGNLVESGVDMLAQGGGWIVSNSTVGNAFLGAMGISKEEYQQQMKDFVTAEHVNGWYNGIYKTSLAQQINKDSILKYDSKEANQMNGLLQSAGKYAIVVGATIVGTPAAGAAAAVSMGLISGGEAVNSAYANNASYNQATGHGAIIGSVNAALTLIGVNGAAASANQVISFGGKTAIKAAGKELASSIVEDTAEEVAGTVSRQVTYSHGQSIVATLKQDGTVKAVGNIVVANILTLGASKGLDLPASTMDFTSSKTGSALGKQLLGGAIEIKDELLDYGKSQTLNEANA